ncbi:hypothetical protein Pmani_029664 [Petrolisthes manimaculis]|uniref:Uncharacterized protein n=1 Tax=Petrolisthes manimaculis TaxID=1843537 RepID=A0AAE1NYA7_9EUCA|nr:hypothetical protein Pmani_029664 [Petrolisthes manimaculis]
MRRQRTRTSRVMMRQGTPGFFQCLVLGGGAQHNTTHRPALLCSALLCSGPQHFITPGEKIVSEGKM